MAADWVRPLAEVDDRLLRRRLVPTKLGSSTMPTLRECPSDQAERIRQATGKAFPSEATAFELDQLPAAVTLDLEKVYRNWGAITAAYFLGCSTSASLSDIKMYLDRRGWHSSAD